jgi:predicted nucleic acid-binding protein
VGISPVGSDVYLDTAFVVNAVIQQVEHSDACLEATERLIQAESSVYFSYVLRVEFAQALRRLATKRRLPDEFSQQFGLDRWEDVSVRRRWFEYGFVQLNAFLRLLPEVVELPLQRTLLDGSVQYMARYSLGSLDAVHLATALHYGIPTFWTCDDHFQRVDEIDVHIFRNDS